MAGAGERPPSGRRTAAKRRRRERETPEIAAGVGRQVLALGRRLADGDPHDLAELTALRDTVDEAIRLAVVGQRVRFSLAEIGRGLGVTRQRALQILQGVGDGPRATAS